MKNVYADGQFVAMFGGEGGGSAIDITFYKRSPLIFKNYAKFNGAGILLPYTINSDYKVTVEFYETEYGSNSSVIGNNYSTGSYYSHLTKYSNNWYASQGTSDYLLTGWTGNVLHKFVNNNGNNQNVLDDNITMAYTPTTDNSIYYMLGCRESLTGWGYSGYIKSYKIESISTGNAICELKPCLFNNETPCLYDTVNKKFYYADGLTVMDTIPTN